MDEDRIRHLEMIQSVINRLNTNSFQFKGMAITIVAALLAIYASTQKTDFILIAVLPTIIFWLLDASYLGFERKFRELYKDMAGLNENPTYTTLFEMNTEDYKGGDFFYPKVVFSHTIWPIYLPIIVLLIGLFIYLKP